MKVKTNGIELHYTIEGAGPWMTLSHSLACDSSMWDPQMELLKKNFTVLRFDTRGHGQSDAPAGDYTLDQLADDVHGLFGALGITTTHWMGLSMGGMIGQAYALKHPGVFASMVLADTTSRRPPNAAAMWGERMQIARTKGMAGLVEPTLARWFTDAYRPAHPEVMAKIGKVIGTTPPEGYAGCCAAIAQIDFTERLKEIKCPVLILVGEQDHGTPVAMSEQIRDHLPGARMLVIPSASHISNVEQSEVFNRAIGEFLAQVTAGGK
jgi:3-oxoadipate enol-lactonase